MNRRRSRTPAPRVTRVGTRIREIRERASFSQAQVGAPYYTRAYVSAIELGKIQPSLKALEHIAGRLGVSMSHLTEVEQPSLIDSFGAASAALELIQSALQQAAPAERDALMAAEFALETTTRMLAGRRT